MIKDFQNNKTTGGEIPLNILKKSNFTFDELTKFLKETNITPVHKMDDPTDKVNYQAVSVLPLLFKIFEKVIFNQLGDHMDSFFHKLFIGFKKAHSAQHVLVKLLHSWQRELDNSGAIGTILMSLSKACACLPHNLIIAKFEAFDLNRGSLKLLIDYLKSQKQRVKIGSLYCLWSDLKRKVHQGSILGPLLNDLFMFIENCEICNFAGDNTLCSCGVELPSILDNLK